MKKKNVITGVVCVGLVVALVAGVGFYYQKRKEPEPLGKLPPDHPMAIGESEADRDYNRILNDTKEDLTIKPIEPQVQTDSYASMGGEDAPIENSYDLAYAQQLAAEEGSEEPTTTITMYATTDCNIRATGSTDGEILGGLQRGDSITVSKVGEWNTVVFDDGKEGFIRNDLLSDTKPEPLPEPVPEQAQTQAPVEEPAPAPAPQQGQSQAVADIVAQINADIASGVLSTVGEAAANSGGANSHVGYVDPNAAENAGIDVDSINVH